MAPLTRSEALRWGSECLKNSEDPRLDARLLLCAALVCTREALIMDPQVRLTPEEWAIYQSLIERRAASEPVSKIIGFREFWSLPFKVSADVLDPRPDSETLIEAVLKSVNNQPLTLLELGVGSGCLILTLLHSLPHARGVGVDMSPPALKIAQENAAALGLDDRVQFLHSNWGAQVSGTFDIIISNPPYIPSADIAGLRVDVVQYDPHLALDGGADGLDCYRLILAQLPRLLKPTGRLFLEVGAGQAPDVTSLCAQAGLELLLWHKDLAKIDRCGEFMWRAK